MKKLGAIASAIALSASLFSFANTSSAEEVNVGTGFSVGNQYENGGYEVGALQPVTEAWSFNSRFAGANTSELHSKYEPLNKVNILQTILDTNGTYYTIESGQGKAPAIVAYASNSIKQWSFTPPRGAQNLVLGNDNKLYFRDMTNLYAVDKTTGQQVWTVEIPSTGTSPGNFPSVSIDKDGVIYTNGLNEISAVNPNGEIKWTRYINQNITSFIKIDKEGRLIFITGTKVRAYDKDGNEIWGKYIENDKVGNIELLDNDQLLVSTNKSNPELTILNRSTGKPVKVIPLTSTPRSVTVSDVDGAIYVAGDELKVYDKDFNLKSIIGKKVNHVLLDKNNNAFFSVDNDGVYSVNSEATERWSYKPDNATHNWTSNLAMDQEGKVYAAVRENTGTTYEFSMVVLGANIDKACQRVSVVLNSQINKNVPDYAYKATPFYNASVCDNTFTFQFESSDPSILNDKDKHIAEAKARLASTGDFANKVKFIWKDVKTNTVFHEQAQQ